MSVPKRRQSKTRRNKRRSHHHLTAPHLHQCSNCGKAVVSHQACPNCGYYRGRQVLAVKTKIDRRFAQSKAK